MGQKLFVCSIIKIGISLEDNLTHFVKIEYFTSFRLGRYNSFFKEVFACASKIYAKYSFSEC